MLNTTPAFLFKREFKRHDVGEFAANVTKILFTVGRIQRVCSKKYAKNTYTIIGNVQDGQ